MILIKVNILLNIALRVYEPISSNKLEDKNSQEYQDREIFCLNVFRILALNRELIRKYTDVYSIKAAIVYRE